MDDTFERIQRIKEHAESLLALQAETDAKLGREIDKLERDVLLVNALAALKAAAADCRHERVRTQVNGAREQIQKALSA